MYQHYETLSMLFILQICPFYIFQNENFNIFFIWDFILICETLPLCDLTESQWIKIFEFCMNSVKFRTPSFRINIKPKIDLARPAVIVNHDQLLFYSLTHYPKKHTVDVPLVLVEYVVMFWLYYFYNTLRKVERSC